MAGPGPPFPHCQKAQSACRAHQSIVEWYYCSLPFRQRISLLRLAPRTIGRARRGRLPWHFREQLFDLAAAGRPHTDGGLSQQGAGTSVVTVFRVRGPWESAVLLGEKLSTLGEQLEA